MARNPRQPLVTKKHLARIQREELQRRYLYIASIAIIALVVLTIGYGIFNETYLKQRQPVAVVNSDEISTADFQARVRYDRQQKIENALYLIQVFGSSPETASFIGSQIQDARSRLVPEVAGQEVLDQMIDETIMRQEAQRRGINITEEDIDKILQESLGYFPDGTPTPEPTFEVLPTSTLSPLQLTAVPPTALPSPTAVITPTATPTATATATLVPTITPTSMPTLTPTPFTQEGYEQALQARLSDFAAIDFSEADLRKFAEVVLYSQRLREVVLAELEVSATEEQVWARHILVADEALSNEVLQKIEAGEDWCELAATYSTDTSNKDDCGDLSWFPRGRMDTAFENAAFELGVGEISEPISTTFGFHIIQVLGHEDRPLDPSTYENKRTEAFRTWLEEIKAGSEIEILDIWSDRVPEEPLVPATIDNYLASIQGASDPQQPQILIPTP